MFTDGIEGFSAIQTVALAAGLSWASGLRLYLTLFMVGALQHFGMVHLPGSLVVLAHPAVLIASGVLTVGEFMADKIPGFDSLWDALHTFIRIPAGAVLAAATFAHLDPALVVVAGLAGGAIATGAHLTKAGSRALINTSPEPFSNWTASLAEDVAAPVGLALAFITPWVWLGLLLLFLALAIWLVPKLARALRALFGRLRTS